MMNSRISDASEEIDGPTSRSICDAIGKRLRQSLSPEGLHPSPHLQHLIDELRKQEHGNRPFS